MVIDPWAGAVATDGLLLDSDGFIVDRYDL
jgi:hypothetical protein